MLYRRKTTKAKKSFRKPYRKAAYKKTKWGSSKGSRINTYAKITELDSYAAAGAGTNQVLELNTPYIFTTTLGNHHIRSGGCAAVFEQYRITNFMVKLCPRATEVAAGGTATYLYAMPVRSAVLPPYFNEEWMAQQGVKPRLFTRPITYNVKPKVVDGLINDVSGGLIAVSPVSTKLFTSPWLSTRDLVTSGGSGTPPISSIEHLGLLVYLTQAQNTSNAPVADFEKGITSEFRRPFTDSWAPGSNDNTIVYA